jgi:hypothetical protein
MRKRVSLVLTVCILILLVSTSCATRISQEEYDELDSELKQVQQELIQAEATVSSLQTELTEVQEELDSYKANPPVLEVDFIDIGAVAKLTKLKLSKQASLEGTYIVECELELTGNLPGLYNVVDIELYIQDLFIDSERWIDVSSTGHVTTQSKIQLDTGLEDFVESIKLKLVPSFKVFGS